MRKSMIIESGQPVINVAVEEILAPSGGVDVPAITIEFSSESPSRDLDAMAWKTGDCCKDRQVPTIGRAYSMAGGEPHNVVRFSCTTNVSDMGRRPCRVKTGER